MPFDPFALVAAAAFTSGCASVHGLRRQADAVTLILALVSYGLATAVASLLASRFGLVMVPDHAGGWMYAALG